MEITTDEIQTRIINILHSTNSFEYDELINEVINTFSLEEIQANSFLLVKIRNCIDLLQLEKRIKLTIELS